MVSWRERERAAAQGQNGPKSWMLHMGDGARQSAGPT